MKPISLVLLCVLLPVKLLLANGMSGTEFWFGFMQNQTQPQTTVAVTSTIATNGTLSVPLAGWTQNFSIPANSTIEISIPYNIVEAVGNMSLENKGVHLISNDPVFVSIYNATGGSNDATSVLPIEGLGYEYLALTYLDPPNLNSGTPEILIIALEDNTVININPTGTLSNGQTGPLTVTLNRGQTYQVQSYWANGGQNFGEDLSGSFIESVCNSDGFKHKIAVFSGDLCSNVGGPACNACDHLVEQMWPVEQLGTEFIVPAPVNRDTYILKVAARDNGTVVNISGQAPINLNSGDWQQFLITGDVSITANLPIAVGQFTRGQDCSVGLGDPFFSQIIPNSQRQTDWNFFSYTSGSTFNPFDSYVNIVVPNTGSPVFLDGNVIPAGSFQLVGNNRVAKLSIPSNASTHEIISADGFVAYVYGFGPANSYNYNSGINTTDSNIDFDIAYLQDTTNQAVFNDTLCSCEPLGFISNFTLPGYQIAWDFGDGQSGTGSPINHDYFNGIYTVTMSIEDLSGCKIDSIVKPELVIINCDISGPTEPLCYGDSIVLSSVNPAFSYLWSTGETTQEIIVAPQQTTVYWLQLDGGAIPICDSLIVEVHQPTSSLLNDTLICEIGTAQLDIGTGFTNVVWNTNETTNSIDVNQSGAYSVQAQDSNNCSFYDTATVSIQAIPQWTILGEKIFCEGDSVFFQGPTINNAQYSWSSGETTQNLVVYSPGTYQLTVDDGVCISTDQIQLEEIIKLGNYKGPDTVLCANGFTFRLPDLPETNFLWSTGSTDHMATVHESGIYWVSLENQCENWSDTMEVVFDCSSELYVPNAFTPNGDGSNDVFYAKGYGIREFEMLIFDRWGELVFRSSDFTEGWNGTFRGEQVLIGVYTYKIRTVNILNHTREYTGHVSLIR